MDIFDQLKAMRLENEHFNQKTEWLIDGFLPKNLITFVWAKGGNGKSYLIQAVTKYLFYHRLVKNLTYIDLDNPVSVLKDRKIDEILTFQYPNLNYIQRSRIKLTGMELLALLEANAIGDTYKDCVFVVDSLRNIVDVMNDAQVMKVMTSIMNIREAGGTLIIIGHSNKDGKSYKGSINIRDSIDCMYKLKKTSSTQNSIDFIMQVGKERAGIQDCAWRVYLDSLTLMPLEYKKAAMTEYDREFTSKVTKALENHPDGMNKTELLEHVGYKKDDKTARDALERYEGELWESKKVSNQYTYTLKQD